PRPGGGLIAEISVPLCVDDSRENRVKTVGGARSARGAGFPQVAIESSAILTIVSLLQRTSLLSAIPLRVARG
ncbi:hypothetical protein, partial [Corynebacterium glucuronolyticum]|uniref:hypothetical protein n=1 Tax=Corynebacterium glucuronolyticum TaxID=39791 RepID=UPI00019C1CE0